MKKLILTLLILVFTGCSTIKYVPVETVRTETRTEIVRDTIVKFELPIEYVEAIRDTTSHLETSIAESDAFIKDGKLYHSLANKRDSIKTKIVYKDVETVRTEIKEVPVEVTIEKKVVPGWCKRLLASNIAIALLLAGYAALRIYFKRF